MKILDLNVPEYFVERIAKIEQIGGGCVRLYACIQRYDCLIPVYTTVRPVRSLVTQGELMRLLGPEFAGDMSSH